MTKYPIDDPERAALSLNVGTCLMAWSQVEAYLAQLFSAAIASERPEDVDAAFAAVISFETRLAMLNAVVERSSDSAFKSSWNSLFNKLTKLYKKRHEVAHFQIIYHASEETHFLHPFYTFGRPLRQGLSSKDLFHRAVAFSRAVIRLDNLRLYLEHKQGKLAIDRVPGADPARLLRNPNARIREES
jgi:hypothetical protein